MKQSYIRIALLSVFSIALISKTSSAHKNTFSNYNNISLLVTDDTYMKLDVVKKDSHIDLRVSFNSGTEGTNGKLRIVNANNQTVNRFDIKLIKQPDFITVNIDEYATGTYTAELTTTAGIHVSHFTIK